MSWARSQRRLLGWFALGAVLSGSALPVLETHPMGAADDAACRLEVGSDDHDATRIGSPRSRDLPSDHCVVCHLQRALGGAFAADVAALVSPAQALLAVASSQTSPVSAAVAALSSRGPPALSI